ncbi:MAG: ribonuclease P protein component [SAR202 cluster bacterium]|nr:ribonuclease P protein component [SAR202 cluster bacterium]
MRRVQRLTRRSEFEHTRTHGVRAGDRLFGVVAARSDQDTTRFGLAVSKRVGRAVVRNRIKRRIRAALDGMPFSEGWNVVVSARPAAAGADFSDIAESLRKLSSRLKLLRLEGQAGTTEPPRSATTAR